MQNFGEFIEIVFDIHRRLGPKTHAIYGKTQSSLFIGKPSVSLYPIHLSLWFHSGIKTGLTFGCFQAGNKRMRMDQIPNTIHRTVQFIPCLYKVFVRRHRVYSTVQFSSVISSSVLISFFIVKIHFEFVRVSHFCYSTIV